MKNSLTLQIFTWLLAASVASGGGWLAAERAQLPSALPSPTNADATPFLVMPCTGNTNEIGGTVYQDFNLNGIDDEFANLGVAGIQVRIYDCNADAASLLVGSETTDENGEYLFTGLTDGVRYRIEFSIPDALDYLSYAQNGPDSRTSVQYVTSPQCDVDLGVARPEDYHQDNPFLITPCYVNGAAVEKAGTVFDTAALVAVRYQSSGAISENVYLAPVSTVGALWGVAFERNTETFYSGASMRRHSAFGPAGTGAIYAHDLSDVANPVQLPTLDLAAFGYNTGADPRTTPLPVDPTMPNFDVGAWDAVGKVALGDVEMSEDGKTLYAVNLAERELIGVDLTNYIATEGAEAPTAGESFGVAIPDPGCSDGDFRPWGLKSWRGEMYVGIVCSAETSQLAADLRAFVYAYNPTTATWREVFDFPLNYERGYTFQQAPDRDQWFPWLASADYTDALVNGTFNYPQPVLSDIEFDIDGSMILGFLDRMGHQGGFQNYPPDPNNPTLITTNSGGDITRVCFIDGQYYLEGDPSAPGGGCTTPTGSTIAQGPFGQEYYWTEYWVLSQDPAQAVHQEIAVGGLALLPGSGDVATTVFDPGNFANTGGFIWMNNQTGARSRNYTVFESQTPATGGKSNGLGDLELICLVAPIEIGNYAWQDCNGDGVQDPCEDPLADVFLQLLNEDGTVIDQTTTDTNGEYYFNDATVAAFGTEPRLETGRTYYVVVGGDGSYSQDGLFVDGTTYAWSPPNQGIGPDPDLNDSDFQTPLAGDPTFLNGLPFVRYSTECVGLVNHNFDLGLMPDQSNISEVLVADTSCPGANDGKITVIASSTAGAVSFSLNGGPFQSNNMFAGLAPGTYTIRVATAANPNNVTTCPSGPSEIMVEILDGDPIAAPSTTDYLICQGNDVPPGDGLTATCGPCPDVNGTTTLPTVNWYLSATGGTPIATGPTFDPTANNPTLTAIPGTYTFYAECVCGPCTSERTPADFVVEANPMPEILGPNVVCPGETVLFTLAQVSPNRTYQWELPSGGGQIVGAAMGASIEVLFDNDPGAGPFTVKVTETGLPPVNCMGMDQIDVDITETDLVCNDKVNISLDENGCAIITPDVVLEGIDGPLDGYTVTIFFAGSMELIGNKVTCEHLGADLIYQVTTDCDANMCWGELMVEDKFAPAFDCPTGEITLTCDQDPDAIAPPVATDNCGGLVDVQEVSEEILEDDLCGNGRLIRRVFLAYDAQGIASQPCEQFIRVVNTATVDFPKDLLIDCSTFAQFPNLTEPTPLGASIFDADFSTPNVIDVPTFLSGAIYAGSGAGLPATPGASCTIQTAISDDTLSACSGGLKIVRTFSVVNWCTGEVVTMDDEGDDNVQVVKVIDQTGPTILFPGTVFLSPNQDVSIHQDNCTATGFIPTPTVVDNCSDVVTVRLFTPVGEVDYDPNFPELGGTIPFPGLPVGLHTYTVQATDDCGNTSEATGEILVEDTTVPAIVCDEITQITLNDQGAAPGVPAGVFDDGTTDNCCLSNFEVRRTNDPTSVFAPTIDFDCTDVGAVPVTLRAYDCNGNFSDCQVVALIDDKSEAICTAPADQTITCLEAAGLDVTDAAALAAQFGSASLAQVCGGATLVELPALSDFDPCGGGFILRQFQTIDADGTPGELCTQFITVVDQEDWKITFPPDVTVDCTDGLQIPDILVESNGCEMFAVDVQDQIFAQGDDAACYKIVRTYTVLDWCDSDGGLLGQDPFALPTQPNGLMVTSNSSFGGLNYFSYAQVIKVQDTEAPQIAYNGLDEFCSEDADCQSGPTSFPVLTNDNCVAAADLDLTYALDANGDGTLDLTGTGIFESDLPVGDHVLFYTLSDRCGNTTTLDIPFSVVDCKKPTPICMNGVVTTLMPTTQSISVTVDQIDKGSFDACGPVVLSFVPFGTPGWPQLVQTYTCADVGTNEITLYVRDAAGNEAFCNTFVDVQDNMSNCSGANLLVGGQLRTETDQPLANADVQLNGTTDGAMTTATDGAFAFPDVAPNGDYSVTPHRDDHPTNGVTALDLVLITRHILNLDPLDTPYQLIAADANRSETVTALDVVAIRRVILHLDANFPNNTSWRFVDADYDFVSANPLAESYPEVRSYNDLDADVTDANFVAVKIGDVNGNAYAGNLHNGDLPTEDRTGRATLQFELEDRELRAGERTVLTFRTRNFRDVLGWQGTLRFDPALLTVHGLGRAGIAQREHFGFERAATGQLGMAWHQPAALRLVDGTPLFELEVTATRTARLSELLRLTADTAPALAFRQTDDDTAETLTLALRYGSGAPNGFALHQNRPNPFTTTTTFGFDLPAAADITLTVYDPSGRTLWQTRGHYAAGTHRIDFDRTELNGYSGLLYYRLEAGDERATRRMIVR